MREKQNFFFSQFVILLDSRDQIFSYLYTSYKEEEVKANWEKIAIKCNDVEVLHVRNRMRLNRVLKIILFRFLNIKKRIDYN